MKRAKRHRETPRRTMIVKAGCKRVCEYLMSSPLVCSSWTRGSGRWASSWTVRSHPVGWQAEWRWRLVLSETQTHHFFESPKKKAAQFLSYLLSSPSVIIISIIVIIQNIETGAVFWLQSRVLDSSGVLWTVLPQLNSASTLQRHRAEPQRQCPAKENPSTSIVDRSDERSNMD